MTIPDRSFVRLLAIAWSTSMLAAWLAACVGPRPRPGDGVFAHVTHVQRVNTTGGVAPADGCGTGAVGSQVRVPYTADHHFFISNERNPT